MKKVLSFVLVLAMVLGSVAMAFAVNYSDMDGNKYEEAVETLSNLGVLNGYEDGTFKADREIKRSEFAKVVVEALGLTTSAASTAPFSDVPAGKWYTPYVALAAQLGIVNGFGDGTFRPDQTITDTQAIVMVVRALGYTDEYFGGYNAAKYISQATALQLMKSVNAGTGASTRGNVAQLVYNALGVQIKKIDNDGNAVNTVAGDTMQARLMGSPYAPAIENVAGGARTAGSPFLFDGQTNVASGKNMLEYAGKYITALQKDNKIVNVKQVLSKTLVGAYDGTNFKTADATYSFYLDNGAYANSSTAAIALINNGQFTAGGTSLSAEVGNEIALEVALNGTVITDVYSATKWTAAVPSFQYAKDDLDGLKLHGAYDFKPNSVGKVDEASFILEGVDNLADIAVDNIVTVYVNGGTNKIAKIEVGTKTVEGQVTEKKSNGKYVIGGTAYDMTDASTYAPALGDKGTFLLAYDGTVFGVKAAESAAATKYYAILLEKANGSTGINSSTAKVQLVKDDASVAILTGDKDAAPNAVWSPSALTTDAAVVYTLNDNGQVHSIAQFAGTGCTAAKVAKDGTVALDDGNSYKLTASTKLLVKTAAGKYSAAKAADFYGQTVTLASVAVEKTQVVFAVVNGSSVGSDSNAHYAIFNGYTTKYASAGNYTELNVLEAGTAKAYRDSESSPKFATASAVATKTAVVYSLSVNTDNTLAAAPVSVAASGSALGYTTKTAVDNGFVVVDATTNHAIASDIVVYVWKTNAWTVGSTADLAKTDNGATTITLYDLNGDGAAEIATVAK